MVFMDYTPLFKYMEKHKIPCDTLVKDSVVSSGVLNRLKHNLNVKSASLCRIADYFLFTRLSQMCRLRVLKDNSDIPVQPIMRYDYYQRRKVNRHNQVKTLEKQTKTKIKKKRDQ